MRSQCSSGARAAPRRATRRRRRWPSSRWRCARSRAAWPWRCRTDTSCSSSSARRRRTARPASVPPAGRPARFTCDSLLVRTRATHDRVASTVPLQVLEIPVISDSTEEETSPEAEGAGGRSMSFCRGGDGEAEGRKVRPAAAAGRAARAPADLCPVAGRVGRRGAACARRGGHGRRAARGRLPARARGAAAGAGAPHRRAHHQLVLRPVSAARPLARPDWPAAD